MIKFLSKGLKFINNFKLIRNEICSISILVEKLYFEI